MKNPSTSLPHSPLFFEDDINNEKDELEDDLGVEENIESSSEKEISEDAS